MGFFVDELTLSWTRGAGRGPLRHAQAGRWPGSASAVSSAMLVSEIDPQHRAARRPAVGLRSCGRRDQRRPLLCPAQLDAVPALQVSGQPARLYLGDTPDTAWGQSAKCAAQSTLLSPHSGRSTPRIRTPAAVSGPGANNQPGISRELDVLWKARHGTPSGSPAAPCPILVIG